MFRDFFSFAVGAIVALVSVMPYEKCMKSLKTNMESAYAFIARMDRLAKIEVHTGLDVDWIEATRAWTGLQKECAKTAAETCQKLGDPGINKMNNQRIDENNYKPLAKVAKQFERNPDLGMDSYNLTKTYLDNRDQIDKKALGSVMEARNADRSSKQLAEALSKHFPGEPVVNEIVTRRIPGMANYTPQQPVFGPEIPRPVRSSGHHASHASELQHLVANPDVVVERPAPALERLLDEVAGELDANPNDSTQNEYPSEAVASTSEE